MQKRILVTGASGFVGTKILSELSKDPNLEVFGTYHKNRKEGLIPLDITNPDDVSSLFRFINPDLVIHAAAMSRSKDCKESPKKAKEVNVDGTRNIAREVEKDSLRRMIFISSSHVFSGSEPRFYHEQDNTETSYDDYGRLKKIAEYEVRDIIPLNHIIVRSELLLGFNPNGPSHTFGQAITGNLSIGLNKWRQPLLLEDLVDGIQLLEREGQIGTFHLAGKSAYPHLEVLESVAKITGAQVIKNLRNETVETGLLLDTGMAQDLGFKPRTLGQICMELESQLTNHQGIEKTDHFRRV